MVEASLIIENAELYYFYLFITISGVRRIAGKLRCVDTVIFHRLPFVVIFAPY